MCATCSSGSLSTPAAAPGRPCNRRRAVTPIAWWASRRGPRRAAALRHDYPGRATFVLAVQPIPGWPSVADVLTKPTMPKMLLYQPMMKDLTL